MKTKKILFYLLATLLGGCVPVISLHPLYNKQNLVFEEKLLGTWVDDSNDTTWEFKHIPDAPKNEWEFERPDEPNKAYELIFSNNDGATKGSFFAHLVKLKGKLFLDVYPNKLPSQSPDPNEGYIYNMFFLVPVHTFIKIDSVEPQLKLQLTDDDDMEKLLKTDPNAIKHEFVEDRLILTASTNQLQAFVLKYADDARVFTNEIVLTRKKTKETEKSPEQDPNKTDPNATAPEKSKEKHKESKSAD